MPSIRIPAPLRNYTNGLSEVPIQGSTVSEALSDLVSQHPGLEPHLFNGSRDLRPYVNLFLGEENVKDQDGMLTKVDKDDRLLLIPSIAGG